MSPSHEGACTSEPSLSLSARQRSSASAADGAGVAVSAPPHANERHTDSLTIADRLALRITALVGTMACVGVFACISLIALPAVIRAGSPTLWVAWLSSQFLQLVLLPLLMVGQNLQGRHAEARAQADFEVNQKAYADAERILTQLSAIDARTLELVEQMAAKA